MSEKKRPSPPAEQRTAAERKAASKPAEEQDGPRDLPHGVVQRTNMQRQGKQMHQQDGK